MWIDTRECVPLSDGTYLVQTVYGEITSFSYTHEAGWNTHYNTHGVLCADSAIEDTYVARWYETEKPKPVPEAWVDEHTENYKRKKVSK